MNIIKQTGGNIILVDAAGNILKSFVNVNALDIVSNNEIIIKYGFNQWHSLFANKIDNTQVEPAAAIPFSGDAYALAALLSSDFFYPSTSAPCPPSTSLSTAKLMKTGQTTSYRTGDDGDLEEGRNVDFFTLAENNPFGNTDRFTDELGGSTYTNDIVIDWSTYDGSTVLGWYRVRNGVNITGNDAIDEALTLSIAGYTSGWRLPNVNEGLSIMNFEGTSSLNYLPFNINLGLGRNYTSTTNPSSITQLYGITASSGILSASRTTAGTGWRYIPCRTFTVTGTTLS